ncbi:iron ABC transporter permease [Heyndrickxia sporothermodurans]|uniref:Iron ABC transporter permease n=1 Tax=Heyndrickxia sporothermodurans TaxID=46224 RepID=A0AB37HGZ6_9BACI|nr:iron ABC transporter permease [Heyndrickxia sporothermodurans]MBL5768425.1 iron ABC transporter permease [Heyndrickxia sporothermodurans]MBL5772074.1 iron ABC transporter permease [Heyndrickxia sporothermodurans]MBL5775663.1 iron ABC transporter permease [Heyndrickxia sporothermodurans]MBL5779183.1 iron ABC transporter permease [Heyndrickxia sporothermodurans]MBL5780672.1 iron ABC transporter permease [Heyndrickxia sporothermodurans]
MIKNRNNRLTILLLIPILLILIAYVLYPSIKTLIESLYQGETFTFANYSDFFVQESKTNLEALWNSVYISLLSVFVSALIGIPLAIIFNRYDFPGRSFFSTAAIMPMVLPSLVGVMAFMFLYGETGLIPNGIKDLFGLEKVPFKLGGVSGILIVHAYTMYVYFYMTVSSAINKIDPSLEEAAHNLGASKFKVFWKVTFPLLTPAIVAASLLVFMISMASFSAPFLLAGGYRVLSLQIYFSKINGDMEIAATQSVILSIVSISFLIFMRWYQNRKDYRMATKGIGAHRSEVKNPFVKWILVVSGVIAVIILLLPHLTILLLSLVPDGTWTWQTYPTVFNIENYRLLLDDPNIWKPIKNSLLLAILATAGNLVFGVFASYLLVKRKFVGKSFVDILVMIPWALPATVIGMNLIFAFNEPNIFSFGNILVGTFWILPLAYFVRHIPLVVRSTNAVLEQLDDSLEEASRNLGAKWFYTFRKVILPIIMPGVMSGTLLAFVESVGEFPTSVLLYTLSNRPISIEIMNQLRMFNMGQAAAYGMFQIILIALVLFISNKFFGVKAEQSL